MAGFSPGEAEFLRLAAAGYNVIPVSLELIADLLTPMGALLRLGLQRQPYAFLLESVEGGERLGRYSFLGVEMQEVIELWPGRARRYPGEMSPDGAGEAEEVPCADPLAYLEARAEAFRLAPLPGIPRAAIGLVGYAGYELVYCIERLPARKEGLGLPDGVFVIPRVLLLFDHVQATVRVVVNVFLNEVGESSKAGGGTRENAGEAGTEAQREKLRACYRAAVAEGERIIARLQAGGEYAEEKENRERGEMGGDPSRSRSEGGERLEGLELPVRSNFTREAFMAAVIRAKEYIAAGDIFQVVPSQRLEIELECTPLEVYRTLRALNPSPYLFYLQLGSFGLVGSSPEVLVRLQNGRACVRPIAGTRPRGATAAEDLALANELRTDEKERAEHVMLVDLGRNDLGRVCRYGSVQATELLVVERYSHVMHLVSQVEGELAPGKNQFALFRAAFPAGTLTGAPKVRAMEIIHELEPAARGPYGGGVGYFGFDGNMDFCITIRTIVYQGRKAWVQAGAGIVADSDPEREYVETMNKARALVRAVALSGRRETPAKGGEGDDQSSGNRQLRFLHL